MVDTKYRLRRKRQAAIVSTLTTLCVVLASSAIAQSSWQMVTGYASASAPRVLQGDTSGKFLMYCDREATRGLEWYLVHTGAPYTLGGPNGEPVAEARLEVDGTAFPAQGGRGPDGSSVALSPAVLTAMKAGTKLTVAYSTGKRIETFVISLNGAAKAIEHIAKMCR